MEEAGGENELHQYLRLEDDDSFALLIRVPGSAFITGHVYAVPDEGDEGEDVPPDERRFFMARGDQAFIHFPNIHWTENRGYQVVAVGKSGTYHSDREELSVETARPLWTYDRGESPAHPDTTAHVYHRFVANETAYYLGAMFGHGTLQGEDFLIEMTANAMGAGGGIYIGTRSVEDTVLYGEPPGCA